MSNYENLNELLQMYINDGLPGLGCIVAQDGKTLFEKYYGYENIETKKPITKDTLYKMYSLTKVVVATAGMMLFERGKIVFTDPLYEYIPEFKDMNIVKMHDDGTYHIERAKNHILIKHLFTMSTGYGYNFYGNASSDVMKSAKEKMIVKNKKYTLLDEAKAISVAPLSFEPGEHWQYGFSMDLVGALIEQITGDTLGNFLKNEIFEPIGMKDTFYRFGDGDENRLANLYDITESGNFVKNKYGRCLEFDESCHERDSRYEPGGAGLISTARDYTKFAQMLACGGIYNGNKIIGRKTIDLMRTNQLSGAQLKDYSCTPYHDGYGYGFGVRTLIKQTSSNSSLGEFGWSGKLGTYLSVDPSEKLSIVYTQQTNPSEEHYYHPRIKNIVNGCL